MKTPEDYFQELSFNLSASYISDLHKSNPTEGLTNFYNGKYDFAYGAFCESDKESEAITIFYVHYKLEIRGYGLSVPIDYNEANEMVFIFAKALTLIDPELDVFTVYNTLQHFRSTALDNLGYSTFNPFNIPNGTFSVLGQGIIPVWQLDRKDFFEETFKPIVDKPHLDPVNKIYLMLDRETGYFKIGKSKNPRFREGTLQSKKPETALLAYWTAPAKIEKELHLKYASKRKRGEWFKLSISDLDEIKDFMNAL